VLAPLEVQLALLTIRDTSFNTYKGSLFGVRVSKMASRLAHTRAYGALWRRAPRGAPAARVGAASCVAHRPRAAAVAVAAAASTAAAVRRRLRDANGVGWRLGAPRALRRCTAGSAAAAGAESTEAAGQASPAEPSGDLAHMRRAYHQAVLAYEKGEVRAWRSGRHPPPFILVPRRCARRRARARPRRPSHRVSAAALRVAGSSGARVLSTLAMSRRRPALGPRLASMLTLRRQPYTCGARGWLPRRSARTGSASRTASDEGGARAS